MQLTRPQLEVLHILWASDTPLSVQGIAEKSKYQIAGRFIVPIIIENLLAKDAVYQAGAFHDYSGKREIVLIQYAAKIRFDEYYAEKFQNITPWNLFYLMKVSENMNLRSGPGTNYDSYGILNTGETFNANDDTYDPWYGGRVGSSTKLYKYYGYAIGGYVHSNYLGSF